MSQLWTPLPVPSGLSRDAGQHRGRASRRRGVRAAGEVAARRRDAVHQMGPGNTRRGEADTVAYTSAPPRTRSVGGTLESLELEDASLLAALDRNKLLCFWESSVHCFQKASYCF